MNPSASGWIKKLLKVVSEDDAFVSLPVKTFYSELKKSGFIYGSNVAVVNNAVEKGDLTDEELSKVNLLLTFYYFYKQKPNQEKFVDSVVSFYSFINKSKTSIFDSLLGKKKSSALLEDIINKRVHIDDNIFTKNFNYFITNALLFVDVLAYQKFIRTHKVSETYLQQFEAVIETIAIEVFESKHEKSKYDDSLIRLFEASKRYNSKSSLTYKGAVLSVKQPLEKQYLVDIACMASWSDKVIDKEELDFLIKLSNDLHLNDSIIKQSIADVNTFYTVNENNIALLGSKNMVQSFYDNSSKMVSKLISRNSKRLLKELRESKELMVLLKQSTYRELTDDEKRDMQDQLLDIFKSIPSLAIFMLPGGAILLPLFVKFIPKMLPSAFDENRIED